MSKCSLLSQSINQCLIAYYFNHNLYKFTVNLPRFLPHPLANLDLDILTAGKYLVISRKISTVNLTELDYVVLLLNSAAYQVTACL